ncbi:MAG: MarR family transcriptional regulator [Sulfobacillus benefaciens]|uniref:MarR family transcriptional regulator n=1 Tax=Sulfobacillus benefaciens TaxID=453960 RepID=A0A2T2XGW7_9FIRM|nr:MAG: MarR family transcriptional regulator [Sulfobacillus benefaciens]
MDDSALFEATFALLRLLGRNFRREREPLNITPTQYHALALMREAGTTTLMAMAGLLKVAGPTATRAIDALEQKGLVVKDRDPQDRRIVWLRLSEEGENLLMRERQQHIAYLQQLGSKLTPGEQQELIRLLQKLVAGDNS